MGGIWQHLKHFKPTENWGSWTRMNGLLLLLLDAIHDGWSPEARFIIHCGFAAGGHTPNSFHYKAEATDFHVNDGEPFPLQVAQMEHLLRDFQVFDRVGLGIYPDWQSLNRKVPVPGFHLDTRGSEARWGYVESLGGYIAYEAAKEYAVQKFSYPGEASGKP